MSWKPGAFALLFSLVLIPIGVSGQEECDTCRDEEDPELGWGHLFGGAGAHFDTPHAWEGPDVCSRWHGTCEPDQEDMDSEETLALLDAVYSSDAHAIAAVLQAHPNALELRSSEAKLFLRDCHGHLVGIVPLSADLMSSLALVVQSAETS